MLDRRARRGTLVVLAASLAVVSGTALASTSTWSTSADFLGGALTSTVVDADAVVLDTSGTGRPTASTGVSALAVSGIRRPARSC